MEGFPDIINTNIIPARWNEMWTEQELLKNLQARPVLILTTPYQPDSPEATQLQKMLDACKLQREDYNLLSINDNQLVNISILQQTFNLNTVFLIGVLPYQLGIVADLALNYPNRFNDCIFIPALSLSAMEQQPQFKSRLWNDALKPVFIENKYK
jgi:hypothetical protein